MSLFYKMKSKSVGMFKLEVQSTEYRVQSTKHKGHL